MLQRTLMAALVVTMMGCAGGAPRESTLPMEDAGESASLEAYARDIFTHMDAGDVAFIKNSACRRAISYDIDEHGAPITLHGQAEIHAMLDGFAQALAAGLSTRTTISRVDCRAGRGHGFCAMEFEQSVTMNGETQGPFPMRASLVAMQHDGRWIWTHWHTSLRAAMPTAPANAAPEDTTPSPPS